MSTAPVYKKARTTDHDEKKGYKFVVTAAATPFRKGVQDVIKTRFGSKPKMVGFLANDDPAARAYARWTGNACKADEIDFELRVVDKLELQEKLEEANEDPAVHGIMIYYPVFGNLPSFFGGSMDNFLRDNISPEKDVEGLCHKYRNSLYRNIRYADAEKTKKCVLPCTPLAIVKIMEHLNVYESAQPVGNRLAGKVVTVINRSEIVGHPLAAMLANDGADVYSVDIDSIFLFRRGKLIETKETAESACQKSNVIILGVPAKSYKLDSNWVTPNTVVINVSPFKCVDEETLLKPGVVWVPSVGKVTVSMLERNLARLYENYHFKPKADSA